MVLVFTMYHNAYDSEYHTRLVITVQLTHTLTLLNTSLVPTCDDLCLIYILLSSNNCTVRLKFWVSLAGLCRYLTCLTRDQWVTSLLDGTSAVLMNI